MELLDALLSHGRIVDVMLALVFVEIVALVIYWKRARRGIPPVGLLLNIGAGGSLMLALRAALTDASSLMLVLCLLMSLGFHLADLAYRWQR